MRTIQVIPGVDVATARQYNLLREDARGASYLLTHEQFFPDLTVRIEDWIFYNSLNNLVKFSAQDTLAFSAPITDPRIDLVYVDDLWNVWIVTWSESASPVEPTLPSNSISLAIIYLRPSSIAIFDKEQDTGTDAYIEDRRPMLNIGGSWGAGTGTIFVDAIFDNNAADLPATTATQIDGQVVQDGWLVYVKDCSDPLKIWNIYSASVSGWAITWNFVQSVAPWSWVYSSYGDTYANTTIISGDTTVVNINNATITNLTVNAGGSVVVNGAWIKQTQDTVGATTIVLTDDPLSGEAGLFVFKQDLGLHWTETDDYTYDAPTKTITFPALTAGEKIEVRYMKGNGAQIQQVIPVEVNVAVYNANFGEYIVVTNATSGTTINLPDATIQVGWVIKIKKFSGEDVQVVTIVPFGAQLIDGFTGSTMNINRTMYTFTSVGGNWYLGD